MFNFTIVAYNFNGFVEAEPSFHTWNKSHLIMVMKLLMYCWIWLANILLRIFTSIFIRNISLFFFFFVCGILVWFWCQHNAGFIKHVWKSFSRFCFLEDFEKDWYWFFFECLMELTKEAICSWTSVSWKVFDYWLLLAISQPVPSLFHHDSVLVGCMFPGRCAFPTGYPTCWHVFVHSNLLWSFVCLIFHFWLCLFEFFLFFLSESN